jgi:hypothetical protein
MTSDKQNQANLSNAQHSTGPTSAKGLATSSQNARKHGANAKHLVDADEIALYENMMVSLKEKYPSDNPLVGMQLARIAKLNVQLTRVQQFIDAAFMLAKDHSMTDEALMELLQMSDDEKLVARQLSSEDTGTEVVFDLALMEISAEVGQVDTLTFKTPQDFLTYTPRLCKYLYDNASANDISITKYISSYLGTQLSHTGRSSVIDQIVHRYEKITRENNDLRKENEALKQGFPADKKTLSSTAFKSKDDAILELSVKDLQKASDLIQEMITGAIQTNHKLYTFLQVRKVEHNPLPLEYDNLDKLFRYQTSIQRQLSSALGELLILNKS